MATANWDARSESATGATWMIREPYTISTARKFNLY